MDEQIYKDLEKNLEAMLYESIAKIGYDKNTPISIYYTKPFISHILKEDAALCIKKLEKFKNYIEPVWGKIDISEENERFKITVYPKGIEYVYNHNKDNHFIKDLIGALSDRNCSFDTILSVFKSYSNDIVTQKSKNGEFDCAIYFKDENIDPFVYCFTFDSLGKYYHRFTKFDYENITDQHWRKKG